MPPSTGAEQALSPASSPTLSLPSPLLLRIQPRRLARAPAAGRPAVLTQPGSSLRTWPQGRPGKPPTSAGPALVLWEAGWEAHGGETVPCPLPSTPQGYMQRKPGKVTGWGPGRTRRTYLTHPVTLGILGSPEPQPAWLESRMGSKHANSSGLRFPIGLHVQRVSPVWEHPQEDGEEGKPASPGFPPKQGQGNMASESTTSLGNSSPTPGFPGETLQLEPKLWPRAGLGQGSWRGRHSSKGPRQGWGLESGPHDAGLAPSLSRQAPQLPAALS